MLITCLRHSSLLEFNIRTQIQSFQVLYNVDRLAQSAIFANLLQSN
jgi:hypothetical protein